MITKFHIIPPPNVLKDYVLYMWIFEGKASPEEPYFHKMVPNGFSELIYQYKGSSTLRIEDKQEAIPDKFFVAGQCDRLMLFELKEDFGLFGICMFPYTLPVLCGIKGDAILNRQLPLSDFSALKPQELIERFSCANTDQERVALVSSYFKGIMPVQSKTDSSLLLIRSLLQYQKGKIGDFVRDNGIQLRSFQRKCKYYTGYSPKQLYRIARIHAAMSDKESESLTSLAHKLEYFDQSHFINDFKQLTGLKPSQYFTNTPNELAWQNQGEKIDP